MEDHERPLSEQGHEDAQALGVYMQDHAWRPDFALCSSAVRTRQTLSDVLGALNIAPPAAFSQDIYRGSTSDYLDALRGVDDAYGSVLLVAHNPSIHGVAAMLADDGHAKAYQTLISGYAPATLCVLDYEGARWAKLSPACGRLVAVLSPSVYSSSSP